MDMKIEVTNSMKYKGIPGELKWSLKEFPTKFISMREGWRGCTKTENMSRNPGRMSSIVLPEIMSP